MDPGRQNITTISGLESEGEGAHAHSSSVDAFIGNGRMK